MRHLPTLEVVARAVRARVCPMCYQRPPGSETLGPEVARSCEPGCTIFLNLPKLRGVACQVSDPSLGPYEKAMREVVCESCGSSPTAGDFCGERTSRECPLSRYLGDVVQVLEATMRVR